MKTSNNCSGFFLCPFFFLIEAFLSFLLLIFSLSYNLQRYQIDNFVLQLLHFVTSNPSCQYYTLSFIEIIIEYTFRFSIQIKYHFTI